MASSQLPCQSSGKPKALLDPSTNQPFPNNQIPTSRFNQQALNLMKYVPLSNDPCGRIVYGIPSTGDDDQVIFRIDYTRSEKHSLFGRGFLLDYRNPTVFDGANILPSQRAGLLDLSESQALGDIYTFSPTTVNSLHLNATRFRIHRGPPANYIGDATVRASILADSHHAEYSRRDRFRATSALVVRARPLGGGQRFLSRLLKTSI